MKNSAISRFPKQRTAPKPPKELGKHGRALWRSIQNEYCIEDAGGLTLLETVCRSVDDIQRMRETVKKDGDTVTDRFGQKQPHPLLAAIRGAETVKRQALRSLNLDAEPPAKVGRPEGRPNSR